MNRLHGQGTMPLLVRSVLRGSWWEQKLMGWTAAELLLSEGLV